MRVIAAALWRSGADAGTTKSKSHAVFDGACCGGWQHGCLFIFDLQVWLCRVHDPLQIGWRASSDVGADDFGDCVGVVLLYK
jgi:hypothetical protein